MNKEFYEEFIEELNNKAKGMEYKIIQSPDYKEMLLVYWKKDEAMENEIALYTDDTWGIFI